MCVLEMHAENDWGKKLTTACRISNLLYSGWASSCGTCSRTRIARSELLSCILSGHPAGVLRLCLSEDYIGVTDRGFIDVGGSDDELWESVSDMVALLENCT